MDALDRYLREVRFWLPRELQDDIIAELAEDLRSEIEERETSLGRPLTDEELKAMFAKRGSPHEVAAKFAPERHLIGPALFPVYRFVLSMALMVWLLPALVVGLALLTYDAVQPTDALNVTWSGLLRYPIVVGGYAFACITVIFAWMERSQRRAGGWAAWQASLRDPARISRAESIAELVAPVVMILFWINLLPFPALDETVSLGFGPLGRAFYYPMLLCFVASAAFGIAKLRQRNWTPSLARQRLAVSGLHVVTFSLILVALLAGGRLVTVVGQDVPAVKVVTGEKWLNLILAGCIAVYVMIYIGTMVKDIRRTRITLKPALRTVSGVVTF